MKGLIRLFYEHSVLMFLNLSPRPELTTLLSRVFLEEAGEMMINTYPKQFPKVINVVRKNFVRIVTDTSQSEKS
ncbi:unnamed protein product [Adineta steineri]|uniref:Uncharacterized protein n=1 Tax=Adineta steineri TaxID=433720 RepID=A0A814K337_9BILA|nr:unnamed protein product [Adineta steineri]